jgi:hypothetical protein
MQDTPLPVLFVYGRPGCHLCDESRTLVDAILDDRRRAGLPAPEVAERDITTNPEWERAFFVTIPVLELDGRRLELAVSAGKIRRLLADILDATPVVDPVNPAPAKV